MSIQVEQLADSDGVADLCPKDLGEDEAHIEDNKPRILIMGLRGSGKSSIKKVFVAALLAGLVCHTAEPPAAQWSGDDYKDLRTCVEKEQYLHQGLCCLNCQAGTFVQKDCEREHEQGRCESCEHGQTYTEHSNGINHCLPCTRCRSDEIVTAPCSTTTDTRCQCASGSFCVPDQACEVCRRCARCEPGEEEVKKCTPFSNTECPKRDPSPTEKTPAPPSPTPAPSADIVTPVCTSLAILFIIIALAVWGPCEIPCLRSHCDSSDSVNIPIDESGATAEDRQNDLNAGLEGEESRPESRSLLQETQAGMTSPPLEDEGRGLADSLPNTTSSSQTPTATRTPPADMAPESTREQFRRYLEKTGVVGSVTSATFCLPLDLVLVALYEQPEKPNNALEFVKQHLNSAGQPSADSEALQQEVIDLRQRCAGLGEENKEHTSRLNEPEDGASTEN